MEVEKSYTAFAGFERLATGSLLTVARAVKEASDRGVSVSILVFDDSTGKETDIDLRGTDADVVARYTEAPRGPGRPKLGVVAREVTLLPRQWEWLGQQPGGASVALRRLVHEGMKTGRSETKASKEATYRFMSAIAGNFPGFEEASRALYAGDSESFDSKIATWPQDVREHLKRMSGFWSGGN